MIGSVLPQRWHRSGRLPMKVSRLIPGRRKRSSHGMSVMRPQPERTARRCEYPWACASEIVRVRQ